MRAFFTPYLFPVWIMFFNGKIKCRKGYRMAHDRNLFLLDIQRPRNVIGRCALYCMFMYICACVKKFIYLFIF